MGEAAGFGADADLKERLEGAPKPKRPRFWRDDLASSSLIAADTCLMTLLMMLTGKWVSEKSFTELAFAQLLFFQRE